jgi:hypothetical protein
MNKMVDPVFQGSMLCINEVQKWRLKWRYLGMPA